MYCIIARRINAPGSKGLRLLTVAGEIYTEIEAVLILTGAQAKLVAAGGVCGAEGGCWLSVRGNQEQLDQADTILRSVAQEAAFTLS
jgi:hypothetical protein